MIDVDGARLEAFADAYDVRTVQGDGATRAGRAQGGGRGGRPAARVQPARGREPRLRDPRQAPLGREDGGPDDERRAARGVAAGEIDVDFMISPELETANAIAGIVGLPAARQTDSFADGRVPVGRVRRPARRRRRRVIGRPLREAVKPPDSKVAEHRPRRPMIFPSGGEQVLPGDRVDRHRLARGRRAWSRALAHEDRAIDDVVIFGAGQMGTTIAAVLLDRGMRVRLVDGNAQRARRSRARHAARARVPRRRVRPRVPRAPADRPVGGGLLHERRRPEPLRGGARQGAGRAAHDRADARPGLARDLRARRRRRRHQPARDHRRGDGALRARPARAPDRDARGRPRRDPGHHRARRVRARQPGAQGPAGHQLRGRRGDPRRRVVFPHGGDVLRPGDRIILFVESAHASAAERAL